MRSGLHAELVGARSDHPHRAQHVLQRRRVSELDEPVFQHEGRHPQRLKHAHRAGGLVGHGQPGIAAAGTHNHCGADTGAIGRRIVNERGRLDVVDAAVLEAFDAAVWLCARHALGPQRNHARLRGRQALMGRRLAGHRDRRKERRQNSSRHHRGDSAPRARYERGGGDSDCHPRGSSNALGARASGVNRTRRMRPLKNDTMFWRTPIEVWPSFNGGNVTAPPPWRSRST